MLEKSKSVKVCIVVDVGEDIASLAMAYEPVRGIGCAKCGVKGK